MSTQREIVEWVAGAQIGMPVVHSLADIVEATAAIGYGGLPMGAPMTHDWAVGASAHARAWLAEHPIPMAQQDFEVRFTTLVHGVSPAMRRLRLVPIELERGELLLATRTGEVVRVLRHESGFPAQTVTVARGVGSTALELRPGDELLRMGPGMDPEILGRLPRPTSRSWWRRLFRR